jgi:hypothetical protein
MVFYYFPIAPPVNVLYSRLSKETRNSEGGVGDECGNTSSRFHVSSDDFFANKN